MRKWKREIVWINTGVNARRREWSFLGYKAENVTTTTTIWIDVHARWRGTLSSVGKTEKWFVVEDVENLKTINKIVSIAGNSNSSQGPSISGVVSHKMKRDVFQKVSW